MKTNDFYFWTIVLLCCILILDVSIVFNIQNLNNESQKKPETEFTLSKFGRECLMMQNTNYFNFLTNDNSLIKVCGIFNITDDFKQFCLKYKCNIITDTDNYINCIIID